jgi:hypothetical protein
LFQAAQQQTSISSTVDLGDLFIGVKQAIELAFVDAIGIGVKWTITHAILCAIKVKQAFRVRICYAMKGNQAIIWSIGYSIQVQQGIIMLFVSESSATGVHIFYYWSDWSDSELILSNQSSTLWCFFWRLSDRHA